MAFLEKEHQEFQVFERLSRRLGGLVLEKEQKEAITLLLQGKDVFAVLPTGFGKSLIYQSFVLIKQMEDKSTSNSGGDRPSCLVIVPLRSIVEEQINSNDFNLTVKGFEKTADVLNEMKNNKFQVIYASAEQALSKDFLQLLRDESTALKRQLSLIVVDESHTVETLGKSKKAGKKVLEPFRKDFGSLSSLRSFCPGVPLLAITGTATTKMRSSIRQQLAMGTDAVTINISPNRANIRFAAIKTAKDDQLSYLGWMVDLIREQNLSTPKTIIFCGTMHDVAKVFGFLLAKLGNAAYVPGKPSIPENRLIGIFHSLTWPKYKVRVSKSFRENEGHVRVVVATSALSMGVNFPDVQYVIHMGPARTVVDHIQEAGRAGRNGTNAHNIIYFHGNQLSHCLQSIKEFARCETCLRRALFQDFEEVP
ncbi:uncharacterized protein [Montipora capricornis]|uniref:uncharacterized protein n=1 Tax=Montipora capricornis TaxID=246305 RepID=UPI0035F20704